MKKKIIQLVTFIIIMCLSCCSNDSDRNPVVIDHNHSPLIIEVVTPDRFVDISSNQQFFVTAVDSDNDQLEYKWSSSNGLFDNFNSAAPIWSSPEKEDKVDFKVVVDDKRGGLDSTCFSLISIDKSNVPKIQGVSEGVTYYDAIKVNLDTTLSDTNNKFTINNIPYTMNTEYDIEGKHTLVYEFSRILFGETFSEKKEINFEIDIKIDKPGIVLCFDDKYIDLWYEAHKKLFKENGVKATFFLSQIHTLLGDQEKIAKLKKMQNYGHEMACHTKNHKVYTRFIENGGTDEEYIEQEILPAIEDGKSIGFYYKSFSYPGGKHSNTIDQKLLDYFQVLRASGGVPGWIDLVNNDAAYTFKKDNNTIQNCGSIDTYYDRSKEEIITALERAKNNNEVYVILGHRIEKEPSHDWSISEERLQWIIDYCLENDLKFYTLSELSKK